MRRILFLCTFSFFFFMQTNVYATELQTVIIEVEGDVTEHQQYIEKHHPFIRVVTSYSTIFNGLALEGKPAQLAKMEAEDFIKKMHNVQTYQAAPTGTDEQLSIEHEREEMSETDVTGKNIKVAVIDTGIDYNHPDLKQNYTNGYDVFDFDADPMETLPEEGIPTSHGTHVAGIIAANGELEGVAQDANIYAYRALGPGGFGSTVHILAALEQAVQDEVDVINLSLGNNVNGPDYPTSIAVNKAVELGIPVVIANGNSGPDNWTVGAPATADQALSVGAATTPTRVPELYYKPLDKQITFVPMQGAPAWMLSKKDYTIIDGEQPNTSLNGKIALYKRGETPFRDLALAAQEKGASAVLIYNNEAGELQGAVDNADATITIPVAGISEEAGEWLLENEGVYLENMYQEVGTTIADFSSRGPVAVNWHIKPDILAPGTNITSTVPGGYESFNGTSMAAPYVSGAIALLKEAHPNWDVAKIYHALKTTAEPLKDENNEWLAPSIQGHGMIQEQKAIETQTIIHDGTLQIGKITDHKQTQKLTIKIENLSSNEQQYRFQIPKKQKGLEWKLPLTFTVQPEEVKQVELEIEVKSTELNEGIHEGYLELVEQTENQSYHLPYLFVNQNPGQPKTYGFEFTFKPFSEEAYMYQVYATEALKTFTVDLYDPDTLTYQGRMIEQEGLTTGMNEGELSREELTPGIYTALLTAVTEEDIIEQEEITIIIE